MTTIDSDDVFFDDTTTSNTNTDNAPTSTSTTPRQPATSQVVRQLSKTSTPSLSDMDLDNFVGRPRSRSLYATARPLVYITRRVPQNGVDVLLPTCNVSQWDSEEAVPRGELLQNVQGVHAILCMPSDVIDRQVLEAAGANLRAVATLSENTGHIDLDECERRNVQVLRCPLPDHDGQADLMVGLIVLTLRSVSEGMDNPTHETTCDLFALTEGKPVDVTSAWWNSLIQHKTFGVYGITSLGLAVAARLRQLGANNVIITDFRVGNENPQFPDDINMEDFEIVPRSEFLQRADIVCVCDAGASTQNDAAFDQSTFRDMKSGVILVNSDSGHALNYTALYEALRDGQICAAGLNTCNQTPVPFQYPLQGLRNCVFMPQTQEDRSDLRHKMTAGLTTNLLTALKESVQAI